MPGKQLSNDLFVNDRFIREGAKVFKALGHPSRLAMVQALARGEMCVCDLARLVDAGAPTVSRHLAVLREAGVVEDEKRGMQVFYRLHMECVAGFLACVRTSLTERLVREAGKLGVAGGRGLETVSE